MLNRRQTCMTGYVHTWPRRLLRTPSNTIGLCTASVHGPHEVVDASQRSHALPRWPSPRTTTVHAQHRLPSPRMHSRLRTLTSHPSRCTTSEVTHPPSRCPRLAPKTTTPWVHWFHHPPQRALPLQPHRSRLWWVITIQVRVITRTYPLRVDCAANSERKLGPATGFSGGWVSPNCCIRVIKNPLNFPNGPFFYPSSQI